MPNGYFTMLRNLRAFEYDYVRGEDSDTASETQLEEEIEMPPPAPPPEPPRHSIFAKVLLSGMVFVLE